MTVSPWAQLEQQANATQAPPPPSVFAAPEMTGPPPDMGAPAAPQIARIPTTGENQIQDTQNQLNKVHWQQANPWGTAENHPGKLGKIAHVFSNIGNIAGDIFAPDVMAHIPGTQMNREVKENELTKRLEQENTQQSLQNEQAATAAHLNEETAAAPSKDASEQALQGAQTENLKNPALQHLETDQGIFAFNPHTKELTPLTYQGQPLNPAVKPGTTKGTEHVFLSDPTGKPYAASFDPNDSSYHDATGKVISNPVPYEKPINIHTGGETPYQQHEERRQLLTAFQPSLDSAERMNVMTDAYEKAVKGHDQQAMLNLLANHIGMTMGLAKGARITQHIYDEAAQSMPWIQKVGAKFDSNGYLSGVTLSVPQMQQMVGLAQERYAEDTGKSRSTAKYLGGNDDGPERHPGTSTKNYYLGKAGGDRNKAMQMMAEDGWTVPNGR